MRSALDHAYAFRVLPKLDDPNKKRRVQFPFSKTKERLDDELKIRFAHVVSDEFLMGIKTLAPFSGKNESRLLYLIHELDIKDKHVSCVPTVHQTDVSARLLKQYAPDLPFSDESFFSFRENRIDINYIGRPLTFEEWIKERIPPDGLSTKLLDIPVKICFKSQKYVYEDELLPTLRAMLHAASEAVAKVLKIGRSE